MISIDINGTIILNVYGVDYRCFIVRKKLKKADHYKKKLFTTYKKWIKNIMFGDVKIKKHKFNFSKYKYPVNISNGDIDQILISEKVYFGKMVINTLLAIKMMEKVNHYMQCFQI